MRRRLVVLMAVAMMLLPGCSGDLFDNSGSPYPALDPQEFDQDIDEHSGLPWVEEADLPVTARATLQLIDAGGPFPYEQDGGTYQNREGELPDEPTGYFAEYTVITPGEADRGAWRIIVGEGEEFYWTEDQSSFDRIRRDG